MKWVVLGISAVIALMVIMTAYDWHYQANIAKHEREMFGREIVLSFTTYGTTAIEMDK